MPDRNRIYQTKKMPTHTNVQPEPGNRQTSFLGRRDTWISNLHFSGVIFFTFPRPIILQLNIEGLTTSKINVLDPLAVKNVALVVLLFDIHCTSSEKLIYPSFELHRFSLSRKNGFSSFVHERLRYTFLKQSPLKSENRRPNGSV